MLKLLDLFEADDPISLSEKYYERLKRWEERINIFITLREWGEIQLVHEPGKPLSGGLIPVKDNISTRGVRTTCGSRILENYIPPYDAYAVERLGEIGLKVVGKTNMDEFGMGSTGENSGYGPTRNPWNTSHVPGGSSSGSAAAVAVAGGTSLGSDTGGSVRLPAAYCYVLGLKPTYGLVSRYGLVSYADSLEQIGILARYPEDMAYILYHISKLDKRDMTMPRTEDREELRERLINLYTGGADGLEGLRIGYSPELIEMADDAVAREAYRALNKLVELGVETLEIDLGFMEAGLPTYYAIAMAEASSNLMRYDGVLYGYMEREGEYWSSVYRTRALRLGEEVKRRIVYGSLITSAGYSGRYYIKALRIRRWIRDMMIDRLRRVDAVLMPTSPSTPPRLGEVEGVDMYALDLYTVIPNLTGHPAINIPAGFVGGLPVGIQLVTSYFNDDLLIRIAKGLEGVLYDPSKEVDTDG